MRDIALLGYYLRYLSKLNRKTLKPNPYPNPNLNHKPHPNENLHQNLYPNAQTPITRRDQLLK